MKHNQIEDIRLLEAAQAFAALGSEHRLLVLRALVRAGPKGLSIGELSQKTGITGATMTHHIRVLSQAGLVIQTRKGRSIICAAIAYETTEALAAYLLENCCADSAEPHEIHGSQK